MDHIIASVGELIYENRIIVLILSVIGLYIYYFLKRPYNLPPGPYGLPVIGSVREISLADMPGTFERLAKRYGDIFTLWLGGDKYFIVLNNYDLVKEALSTRGADFSERVPSIYGETNIHDLLGLAPYDDNRKKVAKVVLSSMRKFITTRLQSCMEEEFSNFSNHPDVQKGSPIEISPIVEMMQANVFLQWHYNKKHDFTDPGLKEKISAMTVYYMTFVKLINNYFKRPPFFSSGKKSNKDKECAAYYKIVEEEFKKHKSSLDKANPVDLVDDLLVSGVLDGLPDDKVMYTMMIAIVDGVLTVPYILNWYLAHYMHYTEQAQKIHEEIRQMGLEGQYISLAEKKNMVYTEAFLNEVLRMNPPIAHSIMRNPIDNSRTLSGYNIPRNAVVVGNYANVVKDPKYFPEPEKFKPERFIKDGRVAVLEGYNPFGIGRRSCIGENISKNCLFLLFINLVNKYDIERVFEEGKQPETPVKLNVEKLNLKLKERKP